MMVIKNWILSNCLNLAKSIYLLLTPIFSSCHNYDSPVSYRVMVGTTGTKGKAKVQSALQIEEIMFYL